MSIIDMHCHILPSLDDGASSLKESLASLREAKKQGINKIILTPHHYPDSYLPVDIMIQRKELLEKAAFQDQIDIQLFLGQECFYHAELPELLERGEVLTLADSRYVLVEFAEDVRFREILYGIKQLKEAGYVPILAHYERYRTLMKKGMVARLKNEDVLLQMNFDTVQRQYGLLKRNYFHEDIRQGYVDFMASDCHGMKFRKYYIEPTMQWLRENIFSDMMTKIVFENPQKIIDHIY